MYIYRKPSQILSWSYSASPPEKSTKRIDRYIIPARSICIPAVMEPWPRDPPKSTWSPNMTDQDCACSQKPEFQSRINSSRTKNMGNMAAKTGLLAASFLLLIFTPPVTHGKYIEGHIETREDWEFLGRFCFLSEKGRLEFEFEYPQDPYEPQNILLYFDEPDQWPAVYKSDKSCQVRESPPHIKPENNQKIILHHNQYWSGCSVHANTTVSDATLQCKGGRSFTSVRERWWFIATSRCTDNKTVLPGLNLKYKMWMTNGDSFWFKEFSADEFYILQVDIAFLLMVSLLFAISIWVGTILRGRQLFHTTYKMYMFSLCLEVLHLLIMCIAYGKYANDGKDNRGLKTFARVFEAISIMTFLLMLILMGKGYTITRGRLSTSGSIKIAVFMTLFAITYAVLFIYEAQFFDPGEVLYLYESPGGYGLIAMRLIGWVWFCYAIFFTLKHYPEKSRFYYPFFIFYTFWFWASPCIILIANFGIPKWCRVSSVVITERIVSFLGFAFFLILTRPSAANTNFPYHVRTSQVGVMNAPPAQNGVPMTASRETESFSSHPYAPTDFTANGHPNFTELFTVSNTRTSHNGQAGYDPSDPPPYESVTKGAEANGGAQNGVQNGGTMMGSFPHQDPTHNPFIVTKK